MDDPGNLAAGYEAAWNAHDMAALGELFYVDARLTGSVAGRGGAR